MNFSSPCRKLSSSSLMYVSTALDCKHFEYNRVFQFAKCSVTKAPTRFPGPLDWI